MQELQKIFEAACEKHEQSERKDYLCRQMTGESMYCDRGEVVDLQRMDYETPVKLQEQLHKMWAEEAELWSLEKMLVVAAFKFRDAKGVESDSIKDKVYNF